MNATCKQCDTVFRIDPAKVPQGRVRVRCSICRGVFELQGVEARSTATPPLAEEQVRQAAGEADEMAAATDLAEDGVDVATGTGAEREDISEVVSEESTARASSTLSAEERPARGTPLPEPEPSPRPVAAFGSRDPDARARRLARALISDIATYYPERRDRALASGTLKEDFREEIKKSWQEYVDQVGMQSARGTPHFRDALNDVLAKGRRIF